MERIGGIDMARLILGVLALLVLLGLYRAARGMVKVHGPHVLAWRWFSGHHWHGRHLTDAGWLERGTKTLTPNGRASRWAHKPRLERAAWRTGGTLLAVAAVWGLAADTGPTLLALAALGAVGLGWLGWRAWLGALELRHTRGWVRPLHRALAPVLGHPLAARPKSWLEVPRGYHGHEGAEVTVHLPKDFAATGDVAKGAITAIVSAKLALEHPSASWHLAGHDPHVTYTVQVPPPDKVTLADVREAIAAAKDTAPVLGLGRGRKPVDCDLDQDSPHVIFSMGSGAGKSAALRTLVAQQLNRGAIALILDIKRLSHAWAKGLPNVRYCRDIADIHEALLWLGEETDRRNQVADDGADIDGNTDHVDVGPRLIIVAEELNATSARLASYWRRIKAKEDPNMSPAMEAFGDVFFMGRQVRENILAVAQMFTARTVGGPEARENCGVRILGRYTLNNARMLCPEIWPFPKSSRRPGRVQVCVGGHAKETQAAFFTPAEARELATSGIVSIFPAAGEPAVSTRLIRPAEGLHIAGSREPIGLREAIASGVLPVSEGSTAARWLEAVRKARQYDAEFPKARGQAPGGEYRYDPDELAAWARNRPRGGTTATGTD
jgi:hypothetical protein